MTAQATPVFGWSFWWRDALCAEVGSELFFGDGNEQVHIAEAKKVCGSCPVIQQCAASLLREEAGRPRRDLFGVRAGMTARQRHQQFGHLCPGCAGPRDRTGRLCTACAESYGQVLEDSRD